MSPRGLHMDTRGLHMGTMGASIWAPGASIWAPGGLHMGTRVSIWVKGFRPRVWLSPLAAAD